MNRFKNLSTTNKFDKDPSQDTFQSDEDDNGGEIDSEISEDETDSSEGDNERENDSEISENDFKYEAGSNENESEDEEVDSITTLLAAVPSDCSWTKHFRPLIVHEFQPSKKCNNVLPSSPTQTFRRLFSDQIFDLILEQTNIYGREKYEKVENTISWTDVTQAELEQFLGINIIMGYSRNPSIDSYWSTDASLRNEKISTSMTCKNFKRILQSLHLVDNSKSKTSIDFQSDKLIKVKHFLDLLLHNFQIHFDLKKNLTIDEMMIKFKGRCSFKQYIKSKPIKRGYKVWVLADALTGYVYNFQIYTGKSAERQKPLGEHVVWSLTRELSMRFHHIYFDNFFTSPLLVEQLLEDGIYCTGTIRTNRKGIPAELIRKTKMVRGEIKFLSKNSISIVKWMDRKPVYIMSNFADPTKVKAITRRLKDGQKVEVNCPMMILDYNFGKVGVDRADQRIGYYAVDRRSRRNWIRIFFHFLNVALSNAYVIYLRDHPNDKFTYLKFLTDTAEELIGCRTLVYKRKGRPISNSGVKKRRKGERKISISDEIRFSNVGVHLPLPTTRRRCAYCSTKNNDQRSSIECSTCKVALCVSDQRNCFYLFHTH